MIGLLEKLNREHTLSESEFTALLDGRDKALEQALFDMARAWRQKYYGDQIYIRGLIEFTNYCKNDCYYCGIRCSNRKAERYRLTLAQIMDCCRQGYGLGFRSFVLQGGEDPFFTAERIAEMVSAIKTAHPDCAVTLSVGEHPRSVYARWMEAGADRYLLRHETADTGHYSLLHPDKQTLESRMTCLQDLKELGYQVGCGFMVGSPGQTNAHLAKDLCFISRFQPHMVGIGPFIPQKDTPFGHAPAGELEKTLFLLGLIRLILPKVLLPATTALGTVHPQGRELGFMAGANVCMPNLSPADVREKYALYDNKRVTGSEAAECLADLKMKTEALGYRVAVDRGDHIGRK